MQHGSSRHQQRRARSRPLTRWRPSGSFNHHPFSANMPQSNLKQLGSCQGDDRHGSRGGRRRGFLSALYVTSVCGTNSTVSNATHPLRTTSQVGQRHYLSSAINISIVTMRIHEGILTWFDSLPFRVLLLRRLLWPSSRRLCHPVCMCNFWFLGRRGFPPESAVARVCREAGARDLDLLPHDRVHNWRLSPMAFPCMGSAAGHRYHTCVTFGTRRFSQAECRPHGRSSVGSQKAERAHLPRVGRGGWQGQGCHHRC